MSIREVQPDSSGSVGHVGLALIAEMSRISGLDDLTREVTMTKQAQISDAEILRTLCGLLERGGRPYISEYSFNDSIILVFKVVPMSTQCRL